MCPQLPAATTGVGAAVAKSPTTMIDLKGGTIRFLSKLQLKVSFGGKKVPRKGLVQPKFPIDPIQRLFWNG